MIEQFESLLSIGASIMTIITGFFSIINFVKRKKAKELLLCISIFLSAIFIKELVMLFFEYKAGILLLSGLISIISFLVLKSNSLQNKPFDKKTKQCLIVASAFILIQLLQPILINCFVDSFSVLKENFLSDLNTQTSFYNIYSFLISENSLPLFLVGITNIVAYYVAVAMLVSVYNYQKHYIPFSDTIQLITTIVISFLSCGVSYYLGETIASKLYT